MTAQCATIDRPLTIDDLPDLLPAVLEPTYDQVLPDLLGGQPVELPGHMPTRLPATRVRGLAAALAPQRTQRLPRTPRTTPPAAIPSPVVIDEAACARLLGFLAQVRDRRDPRGRRYPLPYLLALPIVAMTAHQVDLTAIGEWGHRRPEHLLLALGAPTDPAGQARRPDTKTITEALAGHGEDYDRALCAFTGALARDQHRQTRGGLRRCLHIDGKALGGAAPPGGPAPMLLSARFDDGTVAAQRPIPVEKTNEITVFAPLLDQVSDADLAGTVVTADQLHTQRAHARYLHRRNGYYVFTVGGNQTKAFRSPRRTAVAAHRRGGRHRRPQATAGSRSAPSKPCPSPRRSPRCSHTLPRRS